MMAGVSAPPSPLPRRLVLLAGLGAAAGATAGCGVRLEDGVTIPFLGSETPEVSPAAPALVAAAEDCADLARRAESDAATLAPTLAAIYARQAPVVAELARTSLAGASAPPSPSLSPATGGLASLQNRLDALVPALVHASPQARTVLTSVLAQRRTALRLLKGKPTSDPGRSDLAGAFLREPLRHTRAAAFWFEVIAARSSGSVRTQALDSREVLRSLVETWSVFGPALEDEIGYPLPEDVTDEKSAKKAARDIISEVLGVWGAMIPTAAGSQSGPTLRRLPPALATLSVEGYRWGLPLQPFPGLSLPT